MQAFSVSQHMAPYTEFMPGGRPAKGDRTVFGKRLYALREQAGLSQQQVALRLGVPQRTYSHWERDPVAIRPDQLVSLAQILGISIEELLAKPIRRRGSGPAGKMRQLFEAAGKLTRIQQQKLIDVLRPFIKEHLISSTSNGHRNGGEVSDS
jgi:transcriptional regulator with XRE-family HTH domain